MAETYPPAPRPEWGAWLVARAWVDPAFKARLLKDGASAAAELGFTIKEAQLVVVENTDDLHNVIVCTLCSCYPRSLLGQPPWWCISKSYRARAVREPRAVLKEFGLEPPESVKVRVHDSNADMRYLVLPRAPGRHRGRARGGSCPPRHPRQHDRHGASLRVVGCRTGKWQGARRLLPCPSGAQAAGRLMDAGRWIFDPALGIIPLVRGA